MKFSALKKLFFMGSEQIRPFLTRIIMGPQPRSRPFSAFWNARSEILTWEGAISMATTTAFLFPDRPASVSYTHLDVYKRQTQERLQPRFPYTFPLKSPCRLRPGIL